MECFEKGLLTAADIDGLDLRFGNGEAMVAAVEKIARREGIGDLLAEGVVRAAAKIGRGAEKFAMHVNGQEFPMHMARAKPMLGVGYAVGPTGADHGLGFHDPALSQGGPAMASWHELGIHQPQPRAELNSTKLRALKYGQCWRTISDSAVICSMIPFSRPELVDLMSAATGWNVSMFELMKIAERGIQLARVYNSREGFGRKDDVITERIFEPLPTGALAGQSVERAKFEQTVDDYYEIMGWDAVTGMPRRGVMLDLGIEWAAD